ncbi:doublesex- and mab-3-related transcription factor C2-like [Gambusia affinis]|uniref:doublesex- and mab-3-related transcription factor C2-like n=1 Tax=Gambusia affinis TaxID=33528 RepID=UPI001CDB967B|nr:doublesex- and mab-3-related transcription factor C2-like [Gambusia affinis]
MIPAMSEPRQPKCSRCRHHGFIIRKKGHSRCCPFSGCECWKCGLITRRTQVNALQRNLSRTRDRPRNPKPRADRRAAGDPAAAAGTRDPDGLGPDVRNQRPDPRGEPGSGPDGRDVPTCLPPPPLPQLLSPLSSRSSLAPPPDLLLHLPFLPALPAGLYDDLCRPLMIPHFLSYPAPPAEDCRLVFLPLHPAPEAPPAGCGSNSRA